MSFPEFPGIAFPNTVAVRLCDDVGNPEGGYNPVPGSPYSFAASVQSRGTKWEVRNDVGMSITQKKVYFQVNPNLTLSRKLRAGDQITDENNLIFTVIEPIEDRGGIGFLWLARCEYVNQ